MMAMGVPYDLYWSGEPSAVTYFLEAHRLKSERESDVLDTSAWLIGAYVHEAVSVVMSNAFGKKGNSAKYAKEPYSQKKKRAADRDAAILAAANEMKALVAVYNARRKARGGATTTIE